MATSVQALTKITVDMTSDTICPFCYLGKRKLDRAIDMAKKRGLAIEVQRKMHPFQLDPTRKTAIDKRQMYVQKFGGEERVNAMWASMAERGKQEGIDFSFGGKVGPTIDSHRLFSLAYDKGGEAMQTKLADLFFKGYFEEEKDVSDWEYLAPTAVSVGLFPTKEAALQWLAGDEKKREVNEGFERAQRMGITGVPFFVFNNKYAVSGAQDADLLVGVFEKIAQEEGAGVKAK